MHLLKIVLAISFLFCISLINAQHSLFSICPYFSSDFNFYKFSDGNFRDDERTNKLKLGFTAGASMEILFSKRLSLNSGAHFSKKYYTPKRAFSFGILEDVQLSAFEIPLNLKYYFHKINDTKLIPYSMIGITYQLEKKLKHNYSDVIGSVWIPNVQQYMIPTIAFGLNYDINDSLSLQGDLSYRYGKCHCEYLNERMDKMGLGVTLKLNL